MSFWAGVLVFLVRWLALADASAALEKGNYDAALALAQQAKESASKATVPQSTASTTYATMATSELETGAQSDTMTYGVFGVGIILAGGVVGFYLKRRGRKAS